jgi:hypothetical protein
MSFGFDLFLSVLEEEETISLFMGAHFFCIRQYDLFALSV